ncbi:MAG TPA: SpoIIE family protein phosphatase [Acidimicrobiales bacterium]|jgi:serine phosphatase RsbU (regulator of sigma subunit)/DNA-binding response OmpR family regulator/anti-sigma regulatory factor (Ser/Thr protein kinase)|nr:SpoIIE family protein phosphatase [Acidimicrobiales bacterium]
MTVRPERSFPRDGAHASGAHILVVGGNPDVRRYMKDVLGRHWEVTAVADGEAALARAGAGDVDVVLADVATPDPDGSELIRRLRSSRVTAMVPIIMLCAPAADDAAVDAPDAGADDYLIKPFAVRELIARVKTNLELHRARAVTAELARSRELLDEAQRIAKLGSWQLDLETDELIGSPEFHRIVRVTPEVSATGGRAAWLSHVHPDDLARVTGDLDRAARRAGPLESEVRVVGDDGRTAVVELRGEVFSVDGFPSRLIGSVQDVTERRQTDASIDAESLASLVARREHGIALQLQASLLPEREFDSEGLVIASYYRAGAHGLDVGGDWYDVIELGAGRTALVIGDVMGRGVQAAAVMGQVRVAVRAYSRLDLPPADLLELLDSLVSDLDSDQIVTCIYAVFDPADRSLTFANAGHPPPLLVRAGHPVRPISSVTEPPLGVGGQSFREQYAELPDGVQLALYTDGLVERRGDDIDAGIAELCSQLRDAPRLTHNADLAELVNRLRPPGDDDDDIAMLVVGPSPPSGAHGHAASGHVEIPFRKEAVAEARRLVVDWLCKWGIGSELRDTIVLITSELASNAILYGRAPVMLLLRRGPVSITLEVRDHGKLMPQPQRPAPNDEHGRGLYLVDMCASRWGIRSTSTGKAVWCSFDLAAWSR